MADTGLCVGTTTAVPSFFAPDSAAIVVHELGHALVAARFGIRTIRITLLPIGGLAEIEREAEQPLQEFAIAIAGPATSLLLGGLFFGLSLIAQRLAKANDPPCIVGSIPPVQMAGDAIAPSRAGRACILSR